MRLSETISSLAATAPGFPAFLTSPRLPFWDTLPDWFCAQAATLIDTSIHCSRPSTALALIQHMLVRKESMQAAQGQIACMLELHELSALPAEWSKDAVLNVRASAFENACVATCLRLLSQIHDPFYWRHHMPPAETPSILERYFDSAIFSFCHRIPNLRGQPRQALAPGIGWRQAFALFTAALQRYCGQEFEARPISDHAAIGSTLAQGIMVPILGSSGPIDGDDCQHTWICIQTRPEDKHVQIFAPTSPTIFWQSLPTFLAGLSVDGIAITLTTEGPAST